VIEALLSKVDALLIGGGMANTFFLAQGVALGNSLVEQDAVDTAKRLLETGGSKLVLPVDAVIGDKFADDASKQVIDVSAGVPDGWSIYDIGPKTQERFKRTLDGARTIVWNGPMGVFEMSNFAAGTLAVGEALAAETTKGAVTIVGG